MCSWKRFQEHIRYIRSDNPQSAFTLYILQNQHEYGHMNNIMTLLKPLSIPNTLIPYEQYYIQALYQESKLIPEQYPGETNPLFQTVIKPTPTYHMNRPVVLQPAARIPSQPNRTLTPAHSNSRYVHTVSDTQHQWTQAANHITYPIMVSHHTLENIKSSTQ